MESIDFVIPWLNPNDEKWLIARQAYSPKRADILDSQAPARFRDMGTLRYVLRSIEKYCPWYNKIHLITNGGKPRWLNTGYPKIHIISEEKLFFHKSHLPVFSSNAVEMNLLNIEDLSEKFVYLNDDMVIMNPIDRDRFFIDNLPVDFLSHGPVPRNKLTNIIVKNDLWISSLNNSIKLINQELQPIQLNNNHLYHESYSINDKINNFIFDKIYKKFFWIQHWHHPQPYLQKTLEEVFSTFEKEMTKCSSNRFRSCDDLNQYLYRYWQLAKGNFYPHKHNDAFITNMRSVHSLKKIIRRIKSNKDLNFVCFNDSIHLNTSSEYNKVKHLLTNYLEKEFPEKASFELTVS